MHLTGNALAGLEAYLDTLGLGVFSPLAIAWPLPSVVDVQNMVAVVAPAANDQVFPFR